jgi:hypothetical protein
MGTHIFLTETGYVQSLDETIIDEDFHVFYSAVRRTLWKTSLKKALILKELSAAG